RGGGRVAALLCGTTLGAALATYSPFLLLYVAPALVVLAVAVVVLAPAPQRRARLLRLGVQVALLVAGGLVLVAPVLSRLLQFTSNAQGVVDSAATAGNLPHAVDVRTVLGA